MNKSARTESWVKSDIPKAVELERKLAGNPKTSATVQTVTNDPTPQMPNHNLERAYVIAVFVIEVGFLGGTRSSLVRTEERCKKVTEFSVLFGQNVLNPKC